MNVSPTLYRKPSVSMNKKMTWVYPTDISNLYFILLYLDSKIVKNRYLNTPTNIIVFTNVTMTFVLCGHGDGGMLPMKIFGSFENAQKYIFENIDLINIVYLFQLLDDDTVIEYDKFGPLTDRIYRRNIKGEPLYSRWYGTHRNIAE